MQDTVAGFVASRQGAKRKHVPEKEQAASLKSRRTAYTYVAFISDDEKALQPLQPLQPLQSLQPLSPYTRSRYSRYRREAATARTAPAEPPASPSSQQKVMHIPFIVNAHEHQFDKDSHQQA